MKDNISLNGYTQVQVVEKGLSDKEGKVDFFTHTSNRLNKGQSSLYRDHLGSEYNKIKIEINTLDNFVKDNGINKVNFIKIDTEGNDAMVLKGAEKMIDNFNPDIIFEFEQNCWNLANSSFENVYNFLKQKGYKVFKLIPRGALEKIDNNNHESSMTMYAKLDSR